MTQNTSATARATTAQATASRIPAAPVTTQAPGHAGTPAAGPQEPAVPVPDDAYQVSEDIVISDNLIAVTKAGTVIDTKVDGTTVSLSDGTRVTVATDGTVTLDPDFRNPGAVVDASTMRGPGTYLSPDGTQVQIMDGKVVITNAAGEKLTVFPNGSVKIDVPDPAPAQPATPTPAVPVPAPDPDSKDPAGGGSGGGHPSTGGGGNPSTGGGGNPSTGGGGGGNPSTGGGSPGGPGLPSAPPTSQPNTPPPAQGRDIKVTTGDLVKDSQYFTQQSANAATLARCFTDVGGLIKEYGLWFGARSPYQKASKQFATLYQGGSKQMTEISGALGKAAKSYQSNEQKGEELAEGIF